MQNEHSTQKPKWFAWPVIAGHVITAAKSLPGAGHNALLTVSPCGLIRNRGSGPSPYRPGFWMQKLATKFYLRDGTASGVNSNMAVENFAMLPLSRRIHDAVSSRTFISLHSRQHPAGSRIWLCTQALVIKRKS